MEPFKQPPRKTFLRFALTYWLHVIIAPPLLIACMWALFAYGADSPVWFSIAGAIIVGVGVLLAMWIRDNWNKYKMTR